MSRADAAVPPEAIRIEDEVWKDAFARRERPASARRLRAIQGGEAEPLPPPARRTVRIQGRGAERNLPQPQLRRASPRRAHERAGFRPDRVAMWAVLLGFVLVLVAMASGHS